MLRVESLVRSRSVYLHTHLELSRLLGSKDLGFYVFKTLNCIVGKS